MVTNPPTQVVVVQQFSDSPVFINCPVCRSPIVTQVRHQSGILTHLMCGLLCLFGHMNQMYLTGADRVHLIPS
ncbi:hypothetical protein FGIG_08143 [Fasciola gigantica]|uniref:LITAF domain-containing protein n=1 Tax=Fasciola gigantica TaxID=46835 RepID=A0A504Z3I4_FASGI|nr:hypothetical protein FGIG_08143 [Fasciola gigantica]